MGPARLNVASWIATILGLSFIFINRFLVGPGGPVGYAMLPVLLTVPGYVWALAGHWGCSRRTVMTPIMIGIAGVGFPANAALSTGDIGPIVAIGILMCIAARIYTSSFIASPRLKDDFNRLD